MELMKKIGIMLISLVNILKRNQELLKDSILASNVIYFSTAHMQRDIDKYLKSLQKVFKLIAECEDGKNIDDLLEVPISQNFFQFFQGLN